ncbi:hypothetical protein LRY65_02540 [Candidatus Woesebacteria bacterium]|nr:hypothetical protein [Candidatus Woesebacteria bacterium]MCD8507179.1 hypothetical protein [Candidatus Woesebacteria bacterium]MCD8527072.1 hypothetical protein [Candidatus Woesebacteria bacterium]MCD8545927.1 hypothetical protein [Candidatus Woesebacteria bacterium]
MKQRLLNWFFAHKPFLLYLFLTASIRFWNFHNTLFFIWDQGRDAWKLREIAAGNLTLVGPTSGLHGFFLGPLWYYVGVPGYWLSGGNPYGIGLWYIFLACLALPLFWHLAHQLFAHKKQAIVTAYFLALAPGSIEGSLQIWNPLLAIPLMAGALAAFFAARNSRLALAAGFFLLACTLQAEFAYAVFFILPMFLAIPWIRQKVDWRDFVVSGLSVGVTGIPQLAFELRNNWIMTRSLLQGLADTEKLVSWKILAQTRPLQLFSATRNLLLSNIPWGTVPGLLILACVVGAMYLLLKSKKQTDYKWKIVTLFALIPYAFFLIWRGNYGNFFAYYLTPHFIFLIPLVVYGLTHLKDFLPEIVFTRSSLKPPLVAAGLTGLLLYGIWHTLAGRILFIENNAGLATIERAIERVYTWSESDAISPTNMRVYTPNGMTEQYDYVLHWYARKHNLPVARTSRSADDPVWYVILEPAASDTAARFHFAPWYAETSQGGILVRREQVGVLVVETWMEPNRAMENGLLPAPTEE